MHVCVSVCVYLFVCGCRMSIWQDSLFKRNTVAYPEINDPIVQTSVLINPSLWSILCVCVWCVCVCVCVCVWRVCGMCVHVCIHGYEFCGEVWVCVDVY